MEYTNSRSDCVGPIHASAPVALLLSKLRDAKRSGDGWAVRCPAHNDHRASLSIAEGDDGRALLHCHAGCTTEAICGKLGLRPADLFPERSTLSTVYDTRPDRGNGANNVDRRPKKPNGPTFATVTEAVAELEKRHGPRSALWTYHDAEARPVGAIVRWDGADGRKEIRPVALVGGRWPLGGMPEPRPLYCLPEVIAATTVYICEGEKAADAIRALGVTATTSAHGSQSADKTDWRQLAGKSIVILPDNDESGRDYARIVATILAALTPHPLVKIVELPGLPKRGDAVEWIASFGDAAEPEAMRRELQRLVDVAEVVAAGPRRTVPPQNEPFPLNILPGIVGRFTAEHAGAIGCDASYVALPLLASLARAIGNKRVVQLKPTWREPAILWVAIVGESGTQKTPGFDAATRILHRKQREALERHSEAMRAYESDRIQYEANLQQWKRRKGDRGEPPTRPTMPTAERFIVSDVTIEALIERLEHSLDGLLVLRDELSGWLSSFDSYRGGKGGDCAHWLTLWGGKSLVYDRKTGAKQTIYVTPASVSIAGGIQPKTLRNCLKREHFDNGLAPRLLLSFPESRVVTWSEADVPPSTQRALERLFDTLLAMDFDRDQNGQPTPAVVRLSDDARTMWIEFYNRHRSEQAARSGDLAAAWSKLEAYAARLSLIVHLCRWADGEPIDPHAIDVQSLYAAVRLVDWFGAEAQRVYDVLAETEAECEDRRLDELIRRKEGRITARELQQSDRRFRQDVDGAEAALNRLVSLNRGRWEPILPTARGGKPSRVYVQHKASTVYDTYAASEEHGGNVDVDTTDDVENRGEAEAK